MKNFHSRKSKQVGITLDLTLFDASRLRSEDALQSAISILESILQNPAASIEQLVECLSPLPNLFEFLLSTMSEASYDSLSNRIIAGFPTKPEDFALSLAAKLLSRFTLYFWFLSYPSQDEQPGNLEEYRRSVQLAPPVLRALSDLSFTNHCDDGEEADDSNIFIKRRPQGISKKNRRFSRSVPIDPKPFDAIGVNVPQSQLEADELWSQISEDQKGVIQCYFKMLRYVNLAPIIRAAYIPNETTTRTVGNLVGIDNADKDIVQAAFNKGSEDGVPEAYPMVQPMKAALYFDSADGFGEWRILVSTRADRDLREARKKDKKLFDIIVKKIKDLSNGHFSDDNNKRLNGANVDIPIFEAKMTRDSRLVYQVDCIPEFESNVERQVLRVFGIYTHAQLDRRFWDSMGRQLASRGKEYRRRCVFRNKPFHSGDSVVGPATFPPVEQHETAQSVIADLPPEDLDELHSLLVLGKFVTFSQAFLNSILMDQDVAHVFEMSYQEKRIVQHPYSCYVLGRSGTGKTTTMLFKMLGIQRGWESCRTDYPKPRQIFVTQSRVLAEKVEEYFAKLIESLAAENKTSEELAAVEIARRQERGLFDHDEEVYHRADVPKRFSDLKDEHFPMFITFDHLCKLLEADLGKASVAAALGAKELNVMYDQPRAPEALGDMAPYMASDYMQQKRTSFVSYGVFLSSYWSHFPQPLTKGLDPSLVFSEFMGVIKGSEQSLTCENGFLNKSTYDSLSHRTQATFANQRGSIYSLFQTYVRYKRERGDYDAADRTHNILRGLREAGVPGQKFDYIYVDEAQDNLLIDALILDQLCKNADGLFWAGDTAQTISVGSSFRFDDLKAFLYRMESINPRKKARFHPETFQLTVNHRSHGGIVVCAHAVIELISKFWPYAIDSLAPERGIIDGLKPVFFSGWDRNTVRYEQFLFGESGSHIEFGAQQCILVRDDEAREKLRKEVGEIGLIMTLYESKGLEFNDVLLYNFFEDSTVDLAQWRVILNELPLTKRNKNPAPRFDDSRHSGVCRELKFLYVAITRARKNLWIADCSEKGEPMRILWTSKNLIQNCTPGTDVPQLAMSSSPEDWAISGRSLFDHKSYAQAMHCYERAGLSREKEVANAYRLREVAKAIPASRRGTATLIQKQAFLTAANAFLQSASESTSEIEKRAYFRIAAECFVNGENDGKAANAYYHAADFTSSARHYRKANLFDEAVEVVQDHSHEMQQSVVDNITMVAQLFYIKHHRLREAIRLFPSDEEALEFMEDYDLDVARASLLVELGRKAEAADLHLLEGRVIDAVKLFLEDQNDANSIRRAADCILEGLWKCFTFSSVKPDLSQTDNHVNQLLCLAGQLLTIPLLSSSVHDEVAMFQAIAAGDMIRLKQLGQAFATHNSDDLASLLCLDHVFTRSLKIKTSSAAEVASILQVFLAYVRTLQKLILTPDPCNNRSIQRLFAIQLTTDNTYLVASESFLYHSASIDRSVSIIGSDERGILLQKPELEQLFRRRMVERLGERVRNENFACQESQAFSPCISFTTSGKCNWPDCPNEHTGPDTALRYQNRVRLHIQQILICQYYISSGGRREEQEREQRRWLSQLYHTLFPFSHKLGSLSNLEYTTIPELDKGIKVIEDWIRHLFYTLQPFKSPPTFLTTLLEAAILHYTFVRANTDNFIRTSHCVVIPRPPDELVRSNGLIKHYVVHDLLDILTGHEKSATSSGVLFVVHVIQKKVMIDISILCDIIEYISGSLVISSRLQNPGSLHDVTLPRSWLLRLSNELDNLRDRPTMLLSMFIRSIMELLEETYEPQSDHLTYQNRSLIRSRFDVRNTFVARICKALGLIGYNIQNSEIRWNIRRIVTSLRKPNRMFSNTYALFVQAESWHDIARAVRRSTSGSTMDELIQLKEEGKMRGLVYPIFGVRQQVFKNSADIHSLLSPDGITILRADATPFVPPIHLYKDPDADMEEVNHEDEGVEGDDTGFETTLELQAGNGDVDIDHTIDLETAAMSVDAARPPDVAVAPTESQVNAARCIQVAYRKASSRRKGHAKTGLAAARTSHYLACQTASQTTEYMHPHYRLLFLGPLPHLLVCIEGIRNHLYQAKQEAKKQFNNAHDGALEEVSTRLSLTTQPLKKITQLQKLLEPQSAFHKRHDSLELKAKVMEVVQLTESVPSGVTHQWRDDLNMAVKGIVRVKAPSKAHMRKPELNVGDELDDVNDAEAD